MNERHGSDQLDDAQINDQISPQPGNREAEEQKILEALLIETLAVQLYGYLEGVFVGSFGSTDFSFDDIRKVFVTHPDYDSSFFSRAFGRLVEQGKIVLSTSSQGIGPRFEIAKKKNRF